MNMKTILLIIPILVSQIAYSQNLQDTTYFKNLEVFIQKTDKLIKESHKRNDLTSSKQWVTSEKDSTAFYAIQVQNSLYKLDSIEKSSLSMATFFAKGKMAKSQDILSPAAQLQCSYFCYMNALRKAGTNIQEIIKAALVLENYLQNGFPTSKYCPFVYAPVEVNFETPPVKKVYP